MTTCMLENTYCVYTVLLAHNRPAYDMLVHAVQSIKKKKKNFNCEAASIKDIHNYLTFSCDICYTAMNIMIKTYILLVISILF